MIHEDGMFRLVSSMKKRLRHKILISDAHLQALLLQNFGVGFGRSGDGYCSTVEVRRWVQHRKSKMSLKSASNNKIAICGGCKLDAQR